MSKKITVPALSLNAKVEQMARLLRQASKKLERQPLRKRTSIRSSSNAIQLVAKKLREQVHLLKKKKQDAA